MSNNVNNWNMPDFSQMAEYARRVQEMLRPVIETSQRVQEVLRPIAEIVDRYKERIATTVQVIATAARPLIAIEAMGDAQFVYWEIMDETFVDDLVESTNVNKTLRLALVKDKYRTVDATIERSKQHPLMKKHLRLYTQAVTSYNAGHNDLAVNGFTSILDGLLSDVSGNSTHKLQPRIKVIMEKLEKDEVLENEEYATLTLALTFQKTMESFAKPAPFDKKEPKGLNRHWIAHGRSCRRKTKLDSVKMINLIYGVLLICDLDAQSVLKAEENG